MEEQADEIVKAAQIGCAAAHVRLFDPEGCLGNDDADLLTGIYDRVYDDTDVVSVQHSGELTDEGSVDDVRIGIEDFYRTTHTATT